MTCLLTFLAILEKFSLRGGILPVSIVTLYCYWLLYSSLLSDPTSCNTQRSSETDTVRLVLGLVIGTISIAYAGYSTGRHESLFGKVEEEVEVGESRNDLESHRSNQSDAEKPIPPITESLVRRNRRFHLMMCLCSMYMAMLLSNWGSSQGAQDASDDDSLSKTAYDLSLESMWIKIITQWITMFLYLWTLVAPVVCSSRDFS